MQLFGPDVLRETGCIHRDYQISKLVKHCVHFFVGDVTV